LGAKLPFGVHGLSAAPATFLQVCPTIIARIRLGFDRTHALPTQSAYAQIPRRLKRQHHLSPIRKTSCLLGIFGCRLGATKSGNRIILGPGTWKRMILTEAEFIRDVCGILFQNRSEPISISNLFLRLSILFIRIVRLFHFRACSRGHGFGCPWGVGLFRRTIRRSRFLKVYVGVALHSHRIPKDKTTPANIKRHGSHQHARMVVSFTRLQLHALMRSVQNMPERCHMHMPYKQGARVSHKPKSSSESEFSEEELDAGACSFFLPTTLSGASNLLNLKFRELGPPLFSGGT